MRQHRIFIDSPLHANTELTIENRPGHYLINVLRQKVGDNIVVFDGSGQQASAEITAIEGKQALRCQIGPLQQPDVESPLNMTLLQALIRRERMDWTIQKATELGVNQIIAVPTEFSTAKIAPARRDKRQQHWQQVATSACEQSQRTRVPTVAIADDFQQAVDLLNSNATIIVGSPTATLTCSKLSDNINNVVVAIGPEGGWSPQELEIWQAQPNVQLVNFGPRILRAETAAIVVLTLMQARFGDLT